MTTEPSRPPSVPERRQVNRRKICVPVEIEWGSQTLTGTTRDIGTTGMFIESVPPLWMGARFAAQLLLDPPLALDCTVSRIEPDKGFAVTFDTSQESTAARLEQLLASLPAA